MLNKKLILIFTVGFVINFFGNSSVEGAEFFKKLFDRNNELTSVEFGTEASYIRYAEPNVMKQKGYMYGGLGVFTYRTQENSDISSFKDIFSIETNKPNIFKLDTKFSWGYVDYESEKSGNIDNFRDFMFEVRGVTGYDFSVLTSLRVTPYVGLGFRYLNDDSSGKTSTVDGITYGGYERESRYFYLPIGVEIYVPFQNSWSLNSTFEYDAFLGGKQISHLEDVSWAYSTVTNKQDAGFGLRGSFKIQKQTKTVDFYVEPFIRYWKIEDSEIAVSRNNATGLLQGWIEPNNNSTEYGIKLGARF